MLKIGLAVLIAISLTSTSIFAQQSPSIEVNVYSESIKSLDSVLVSGTITGVSQFKPVKLTVIDPDGVVVYSPFLKIEDGKFKKLLHPTLPSFKAGTYIVIASHADTKVTAQTQFMVIAQEIPRKSAVPSTQEPTVVEPEVVTQSGIMVSADAVNGSDTINIVGKYQHARNRCHTCSKFPHWECNINCTSNPKLIRKF